MAIIDKITLKNYRCYRKSQSFDLANGSYFIGGNNAGKSAILKAIKLFFDFYSFSADDFNITERRSKQANSNRCEIELTFNLSGLKSTNQHIRELRKILGKSNTFSIRKIGVYREKTDSIDIYFSHTTKNRFSDDYGFQSLPDFILWFLSRFNISYIHPQEAERLLAEAQEKLKRRLLSTFGGGSSKYEKLAQLQTAWEALRKEANRDLSEKLTGEMKKIWPHASSQVELPEKIDDIVAISAISFKQDESMPDVLLSAQGNGVQSAVLYQTHYLLDCDKTIHRGVYFPIWLMEEPEAFLHADIAYKLGALLVSDEWLSNIQFLATTHSPLILATSAAGKESITWCLLDRSDSVFSKKVTDLTSEDIDNVSKKLGDANFEVYFDTADAMPRVIIEDSRPATKDAFIEAGINVTKQLTGSGALKKYVDVLCGSEFPLKADVFFILDNDKGAAEFKTLTTEDKMVGSISEYKIYKGSGRVYIILMPPDYAVENMFDEYDDHVHGMTENLFVFNDAMTEGRASTGNIPASLTRAHAKIRSRTFESLQDAKAAICKEQDVKDLFWRKIEKNSYKIRANDADAVKSLMELIS